MRAFASTVVNFGFDEYAGRFQKVGETHSGKILALWGKFDNVVPTGLSTRLVQLIPSLELKIRDNASHSLPIEDSDFV